MPQMSGLRVPCEKQKSADKSAHSKLMECGDSSPLFRSTTPQMSGVRVPYENRKALTSQRTPNLWSAATRRRFSLRHSPDVRCKSSLRKQKSADKSAHSKIS